MASRQNAQMNNNNNKKKYNTIHQSELTKKKPVKKSQLARKKY